MRVRKPSGRRLAAWLRHLDWRSHRLPSDRGNTEAWLKREKILAEAKALGVHPIGACEVSPEDDLESLSIEPSPWR